MTMMTRWLMVAGATLGLLLPLAATAEAKLFKRLAGAEEPLPPEALLPPPGAGPHVVMTPVLPGSPACCPAPCIKYRNAIFDCKVKGCDPCKPPISVVLHVQNPCTCCPIDVPVCLPSCCCDVPKIESRKTLFGSGMVSYSWCCGVTVNVRFDKCGDVLVTYRGT